MKRLLCVLITIFCTSISTQAQTTVSRQGNNFTSSVSSRSNQSTMIETQYTWTETDGKVYNILISQTGRCYIEKVSSRTGKKYKKQLPEDVSRQISHELGITYKEKIR